MPDRVEHITYWTRIGEYLPTSTGDQRAVKLQSGFKGIVPDGILVRLSTFGESEAASFAALEAFGAALIRAIAPGHRAALIGSKLAHDLGTA